MINGIGVMASLSPVRYDQRSHRKYRNPYVYGAANRAASAFNSWPARGRPGAIIYFSLYIQIVIDEYAMKGKAAASASTPGHLTTADNDLPCHI
jgi:hypothetical protein